MNRPTPEQLDALVEYATQNGRGWKMQLNHEWMTGTCYSGPLMQVRNQLGPTWLHKFRLSTILKYTIVLENGYVKIRHEAHGTVAAGIWNADKMEVTGIEFTEEKYLKSNSVRQPAMDALARWLHAVQMKTSGETWD